MPTYSMLAILALCITQLAAFSAADRRTEKIQQLEAKLAESPPNSFNFQLHNNELRDLYWPVDRKKSLGHAEAILKSSVLHDYLRGVLSDWQKEKPNAIASLVKFATEHHEFPNLACACWIWAGDLSEDQAVARGYYRKAWNIKGVNQGYRDALQDRSLKMRNNTSVMADEISVPMGTRETRAME